MAIFMETSAGSMIRIPQANDLKTDAVQRMRQSTAHIRIRTDDGYLTGTSPETDDYGFISTRKFYR